MTALRGQRASTFSAGYDTTPEGESKNAVFQAGFLAPSPDSLALEQRLHEYALDVRRWLYHAALPAREYMLRLWGIDDPTLPAWQRRALRIGYAVLEQFIRRGLRVDPASTQKSIERAKAFLADMEARLEGGGPVLGSGEVLSVDLQLAALSGYWACASEFGGPSVAPDYGVSPDGLPPTVRDAHEDLQATFPCTTGYVRKLYAEERTPSLT